MREEIMRVISEGVLVLLLVVVLALAVWFGVVVKASSNTVAFSKLVSALESKP